MVVSSKQLMLAMETEEERIARLENDAATKRLGLVMEKDEERKARLETRKFSPQESGSKVICSGNTHATAIPCTTLYGRCPSASWIDHKSKNHEN